MSCKNLVKTFVLCLQIFCCYCQRASYGEQCNSTEECADHRYNCSASAGNVLRCLCDRFHSWMGEQEGCVQIYNASEIMNMTITVTDNIKDLEESVELVIKTQIAAGLFVFGMVIVGFLAVTTFCIYIRRKDIMFSNSISSLKKKEDCKKFGIQKSSTSTSCV